jgi:hypothetical protein
MKNNYKTYLFVECILLITNINAQQNQAISFIQNNKTIKISTFKEVISLDKNPFLFRFFSFLLQGL